MTSPDYNAAFLTFIEQIKLDKGVVQPWRNKAIARIEEAQAFIHEGMTTTNRVAPDDLPIMQFSGPQCNCTELGKRKDCPVHGVKG
jgi:hypothetical protein